MQDFFLDLDYWIFNLINQQGSFDFGDHFFPLITDLHKTIYFKILIVPLLLFFFLKSYKKKGFMVFFFLLMAMGTSDFTGATVKNIVQRQRPFENTQIIATQKAPAGSKSFYSNHASNIFTLTTYTSNMVPQLRVPLLAIAAIVGYSRIYTGVHYPSDVFAGTIMGIFWGCLFSFFAKKWLSWISFKKENS